MNTDERKVRCIADVEGPWVETDFQSSLIERCKEHWNVPVTNLPNAILATYIQQGIGLEVVIPEALHRMELGFEDGSEWDDDQLQNAVISSKVVPYRFHDQICEITCDGLRQNITSSGLKCKIDELLNSAIVTLDGYLSTMKLELVDGYVDKVVFEWQFQTDDYDVVERVTSLLTGLGFRPGANRS
jgi:hypothetical protein